MGIIEHFALSVVLWVLEFLQHPEGLALLAGLATEVETLLDNEESPAPGAEDQAAPITKTRKPANILPKRERAPSRKAGEVSEP